MLRQQIAARSFVVAAGVLTLVAAITLAGCGGGSDGGGDTGAQDGAAPAAAGGGEGGRVDEEQMLQYTQCLRDNGMDVEDPGGGRVLARSADAETAEQAQEACRQYAPEGMGDGGADPRQAQEMLEYVQCLRGEGIDLSDPDPQTGSPQPEDADKFVNPDADMQAATEACEDSRPSGGMRIQRGAGE